jgi:hypothetical protein
MQVKHKRSSTKTGTLCIQCRIAFYLVANQRTEDKSSGGTRKKVALPNLDIMTPPPTHFGGFMLPSRFKPIVATEKTLKIKEDVTNSYGIEML